MEDDRILKHESTVGRTEEGGQSYSKSSRVRKQEGQNTWPLSTALEQWPEGNLEMGWHPTAAELSDD